MSAVNHPNPMWSHHVYYPKKQCYMCGKTEADLDIFRQQLLSGYEKGLDPIRLDDRTEVKNLKKILDDSYPTENLHFKISTVRQDREAFSKMIPHLNELLAFADDKSHRTLADIRDWIRRNPKMIYEHPNIKQSMRQQDEISVQKEKAKDIFFPLIEMHCNYRSGKEQITITMMLCPICHGLLRQAKGP